MILACILIYIQKGREREKKDHPRYIAEPQAVKFEYRVFDQFHQFNAI